MAVGIIKYIVILSFMFNIGFTNELQNTEKSSWHDMNIRSPIVHVRKYDQKNKRFIIEKPNGIYFNIDKDMFNKQYKQWKKLNTGVYAYIYRANNIPMVLLFIKNNVIKKVLPLSTYRNFKYDHVLSDDKVIEYFPNNPWFTSDKNIKSYILEARFRDVIDEYINFNSTSFRDKPTYNLKLKYNNKYGYISEFIEKKYRMGFGDSSSYMASYGLLMLPKNTKFTKPVVEEIISKYKLAWNCSPRMEQLKKQHKYSRQIMLEKEASEERFRCLDKYLIWDENESE